jgi:hypothetical protein
MTGMRMRQQLIIVVAVVFATVAVGVNVYAATRSAERHAQQLEQVMPVASILDRGVSDTAPAADSSDDAPPPAHSSAHDDPCAPSDTCHGNNGNAYGLAVSNHGRAVSAFAAHIGFIEGEDGPPGALVRDAARSNAGANDPPRSDRAEERSNNDKTPPGQDKDSEDKDSG